MKRNVKLYIFIFLFPFCSGMVDGFFFFLSYYREEDVELELI